MLAPPLRDAVAQRMKEAMKAGDKVLFGKYSGAEVKIDGEEYLILKEDEILGVLE